MRIFHDGNGKVVGVVEGASKDIEDKIGMPSNAVGEVAPTEEVKKYIKDKKGRISLSELKIAPEGLRPLNEKEKKEREEHLKGLQEHRPQPK